VSICLSICHSIRQQQRRAAGLLLSSRFAAERPVGRRYQSIAVGGTQQLLFSSGASAWCSAANVGSVTLTASGRG